MTVPNTMRALVYTGPNTMQLRDEPCPVPGADDVLVRVRAVGICGSDMHAYHGYDSRRPAPLILGHEAAGEIVGGARDGERVTINPLVVDPDCPSNKAGRPHLSPTRQIISMPPRPGAFAAYVTIPGRNVLRVPDTLPLDHAALTEPLAVSWHAVRIGLEKLAQREGARVLVLGGGAIGLAAALVAQHMGASQVHVAETNAARRALAERQGSHISAYDPQATPNIAAGCDLVIDAVGARATRAAASALVRPGGVIVHVGLLPGEEGLDIRRITLQEITITGSYCYTPDDFSDTLAALAAGAFGRLDWFESRSLEDGVDAFRDLDRGGVAAAKIVLVPQ